MRAQVFTELAQRYVVPPSQLHADLCVLDNIEVQVVGQDECRGHAKLIVKHISLRGIAFMREASS